MKMAFEKIIDFIEPFYKDKDIMHNMWHIELVKKKLEEIVSITNYKINCEAMFLAMYFHGFIYSNEDKIVKWLKSNNYSQKEIDLIVKIAWESQRNELPETIEGKMLHDAHILEGGRTYLVVKTLITGSVRGQTLKETLNYMKDNVLDKNKCYLPETIPLCEKMNEYADGFYKEITDEIGKIK